MVDEVYTNSIKALREEAAKLYHRYELSESVSADYFEPGMMENLDQIIFILEEKL